MTKVVIFAGKMISFSCDECGAPDEGGGIGGWSVPSELWDKYGNDKGMLCIPCFENRLGRNLNFHDFTDSEDNRTNKNVQAIMHPRVTDQGMGHVKHQ